MRAFALMLMAFVPHAIGAQAPGIELGGGLLPAGEEARYLRSLQLLDTARATAVGVQMMGAGFETEWRRVLRTLPVHPWAARSGDGGREPLLRVLRPEAGLLYQSGLITADVPGVVWAGIGTTVSAQAGARLQWRFLRAQLAPIVFWAENRATVITPVTQVGAPVFGDARFPGNIDLPQRFGADPYARFDWGDSYVELAAFGAAIGISNARQQWGPAQRYPLVIGSGSGGFAHVYAGSRAPLDIGIGHAHARLVVGRLEQSDFSPVQSGEKGRFLSGFIGTFTPRGVPGLELGATRIVNAPWPEGGATWAQARLPFQPIVNDNVSDLNLNDNNGFASAFIRVAPPGSGLEGYVEISREDFAGNGRWLILEPDDLAQLTIGIGHARLLGNGALRRIAVEATNGEIAHTERAARTLRQPFPPYTHFRTFQGLTNRGQLLGSYATYAGAGATVTVELHDADGRRSLEVERLTVLDWLPPLGTTGGVRDAEVRYALRYDALRFVDRRDVGFSIGPSYTMNRSLQRGDDRWALELGLRWRGW